MDLSQYELCWSMGHKNQILTFNQRNCYMVQWGSSKVSKYQYIESLESINIFSTFLTIATYVIIDNLVD